MTLPDLSTALLSLARRSATRAEVDRLAARLADSEGATAMLQALLVWNRPAQLDSRGAHGTLLDRWASATPEVRRATSTDASVWFQAADLLADARLLFLGADCVWFITPNRDDGQLYRADAHGVSELGGRLSDILIREAGHLQDLPLEHLSWNVPEPEDVARLADFTSLRSASIGAEAFDGPLVDVLLDLPALTALDLRGEVSDAQRARLARKAGLLSLRINRQELLFEAPADFENRYEGKVLPPGKGLAGLLYGRVARQPSRRWPRLDAQRLELARALASDQGLELVVSGGFMDGVVEPNLHTTPVVVGVPVASAARSASVDPDAFEAARHRLSQTPERFWQDLAAVTGHLELERQDDQPWLWVVGRLTDRGGRMGAFEHDGGSREVRTGDMPALVPAAAGTLRCTSWKW